MIVEGSDQHCIVAESSDKSGRTAWCGKTVEPQRYAYRDAQHAAQAENTTNARPKICPACADAVIAALEKGKAKPRIRRM